MRGITLSFECDQALQLYWKVCSQLAYDFRLSEFILESSGYWRGLPETNTMIELLTVIRAVRSGKKEGSEEPKVPAPEEGEV